MIAIVDYGMGNLMSVQKAVERVGYEARVTRSPQGIAAAHGIILPGVGAFRDCMENLERHGLATPVIAAIRAGKPFFGICLGLQLLFTESEEFGIHPGLDIIPGRVVPFSREMADPDRPGFRLKIPHMGWNTVLTTGNHPLTAAVVDGGYYYFVHSFHVMPDDPAVIAATTDYGIRFVSAVAHDNIFATQFHPEKSQHHGLALLTAFGRLVERGA